MAQFSVCASLSFFNFSKTNLQNSAQFWQKKKHGVARDLFVCACAFMSTNSSLFLYHHNSFLPLCSLRILLLVFAFFVAEVVVAQQLVSVSRIPTAQNWIRRRIFIFFSSDIRSGRFGFCKSVWIRNRCNTIPAAKNITNGRF